MPRLATPILLLALPLAMFSAFFHFGTLRIDNPGWLIRGTDNGQNALGAHAYWHDPAAGASLTTRLLSAPEGVPLLYTDSNPLLTLAVKPFAAWLPADAQMVGPFILLNLVLQALFAWLLLRHHAPGPVALGAGVALLAFPPTLANRFVHVNLMAHWTILAALWLFLDPARGRSLRWWTPLIAMTALVHSYLLVMVGAIWASAMLASFIDGSRHERLATVGKAVVVLALVAVIALWLGVGDQVSSGYFGAFSMPLDALWNPGVDSFSRLLPGHEKSAGRGFEGFHYLGAGGLLLVAAAVVLSRCLPARDGERAAALRLRALAPTLVVLAILAIARLHLPHTALAALDLVRASGRLFWPVGYVLVLMALLRVYRLEARRAGWLLIGIVALQAIDLSGMAKAVRAQSRAADEGRLYARTLDPRWDPLVGDARSIAFIPGDVTHDLDLFQELAWRAVKAGRPVANVYAARTSRTTIRRQKAETDAFARGRFVPGRLYILTTGAPLPLAATGHLVSLDGATVVTPF